MDTVIALFGESERGEFHTAYYCESLAQLEENLGHPPEESAGLHFAIQALLFRKDLIFFRVREEGFSMDDYLMGLSFLENQKLVPNLSAICLPGVGDSQLIEATTPVIHRHHSLLIVTEMDLYDYLTCA
jgi:hypothetical protein